MNPELIAAVRAANLEHEQELSDLAAQLKKALPTSVQIVKRGWYGSVKFQALTDIVANHSLKAELLAPP